MTELINQAGEILSRGAELLENPQVGTAINGMFSLLKNAFKNNKRAKERLELIEKEKVDEELINQVKTNLDDLLYENEDLQKQLAEKIEEIQLLMKQEGVANTNKTNIINVNNSSNTIALQDIDTKGGDINIK